MSIFIASFQNLRLLKNILMTDYEVRSSHSSELIAALCGFNTYAAFKTQLSKAEHAAAARVDFDRFEQRHSDLGYDRSSGEWMGLSFNNLEFVDRPWFFHTAKQMHSRDRWYYASEKLNIPFITILKKRKYCYLEWDCVSVHSRHEGQVNEEIESKLTRDFRHCYQILSNGNEPNSIFDGSSFCGNVDKISERLARDLAEIYFMRLTPCTLEP